MQYGVFYMHRCEQSDGWESVVEPRTHSPTYQFKVLPQLFTNYTPIFVFTLI
jgi:hypothetical protein